MLAVVLAASAAFAQEERPAAPPVPQHSAYAGVRIGYLEVEGVDSGSLNVGLTGGVEWRRAIAIEGSIDYHKPEYDQYARSTIALQLSLCLYPPPIGSRLRIYGVGGVGWYYSEYDVDPDVIDFGDRSASDGGFHAGGGLEVRMGPDAGPSYAAFVVDSRWLFTRKEQFPSEKRSDGILATVGFRFFF